MRAVRFVLCLTLIAPVAAAAQHPEHPRELRVTGTSAVDALCTDLLDALRNAEAEGRLDFTAEVELSGSSDVSARVWMGSAYSVGRINFAGHSTINDTTLRRAMTIHERQPFDVGQLRRSLARINDLGIFQPLTLADIGVVRRADGATADVTIALRERKRRWWSVSGPTLPRIGLLQASVASRLPPWGRGVVEAATYFVSLNMTGFAKPFLALERPVLPGQQLFSGFAISPALSPRAMLTHYGRTHLAHAIGGKLNSDRRDALAVPVTSAGRVEDEPLICKPPTPRLQRLRRVAAVVVNIALAAWLP